MSAVSAPNHPDSLPHLMSSVTSTNRLKVIVTGGHPGDPEYGCGGTVAQYVEQGHEVVFLYLNIGEVEDPQGLNHHMRGVRVAEAQQACELLRARPSFATQIDGDSIIDKRHCAEFRQILEDERPDIVFTHWPFDNHPDHRANWMLVYDAWRKLGRRFDLWYYEVSNGDDTLMFHPTHYVDITAYEPRKRAACYAHASQSPDEFYRLQSRIAEFRGIEAGCSSAEAFIRQLSGPSHLPLPG